MKVETFTLTSLFWLLLLPVVGDAEGKYYNPLLVYVHKGEDAVLHVETNISLKYVHLGSPKRRDINTKVLYIRVGMKNASLDIVRGVTSNNVGRRITFHGDLSHGALFTLSNITRNATKLRMLYQELGKGLKKQDYLIIIVEALTSSLSPSVVTNHSSGNASAHPAVPRAINTTETGNDTDPAKSTPSEPSTSLLLLVIPACIILTAVRLILLLIVSVRECMKAKNKIEEHQATEGVPLTMDCLKMGDQPGVPEGV